MLLGEPKYPIEVLIGQNIPIGVLFRLHQASDEEVIFQHLVKLDHFLSQFVLLCHIVVPILILIWRS
jgi:hypothetical protein